MVKLECVTPSNIISRNFYCIENNLRSGSFHLQFVYKMNQSLIYICIGMNLLSNIIAKAQLFQIYNVGENIFVS